MANVLASIAGRIRDGHATSAEIAACLGITRDQLADRLALMERQGYLARQGDGSSGPAPPACRHCCSCWCGCDRTATVPALYTLTKKGERLARNGGSSPASPG